MGRLEEQLLGRAEAFCDRVIRVAEAVAKEGISRRVVDQMMGSGTAVAANLFEADEAMSRADFVKCLAISVKELNETRFWLRLVGRNGWVAAARLDGLEAESVELKRILGTMIAKVKAADRARAH